ncbi:MAG: NAD(P)-dependent oxidoreductase [Chloroflexota bacterium]|nr:NAD(P)-dependent oxidoreductase [Chloroflexota bacterium]
MNRIGVVGTGFIAKGFVMALDAHRDLVPSKVLTRTSIDKRTDFPRQDLLTNSVDELIDNSDLVFECSGDVTYATDVVDRAMAAGRPIVTMDADLQVTTGSYFARRGYITEAEGDQPGCLAALKEDVVRMGFKPIVYGNIKGFLNHNPTEDEMLFWAKKQNLSLQMTTSFTDGTKVQIEQALVANGLGAGIAAPGLLGIPSEDVATGAAALAAQAERTDGPISDYILSAESPPGVFIVAEHDERQRAYLVNFKLGEGPYYVLLRSFHLCHLEVAKTLERVLDGKGVLLNNSTSPSISVAAIAKRRLVPGQTIERGIGSFDVRGVAVNIADRPDHVPIGLLADAVVLRHMEPGQQVTFDDVEIPDTLAFRAWREVSKRPRPTSDR